MMFPKNGNYECRKCGNIIPIKSDEKKALSPKTRSMTMR